MRVLFRLCAVLSICFLPVLAQSPTPEGDALFAKQDWQGAAKEFQRVADREPKNGRAWFRLASALYRTGDFSGARVAFEHAKENQFQTPYAMAGIARSYAAENQPAKAVESLQESAKAGFVGIAFIRGDQVFTRLKGQPGFEEAVHKIEMNANPCAFSPEYRQFDFWVGEWDVEVSGQIVAQSSIQKINEGCVVQENWMPFTSIQGKSWNIYNTVSGKWEQLWMSGGGILKFEGNLKNGAMYFEGVTPQKTGPPVLQRLTFTPTPEGRVHQFSESSADGGKTWTVGFDGIYIPRKDSSKGKS